MILLPVHRGEAGGVAAVELVADGAPTHRPLGVAAGATVGEHAVQEVFPQNRLELRVAFAEPVLSLAFQVALQPHEAVGFRGVPFRALGGLPVGSLHVGLLELGNSAP